MVYDPETDPAVFKNYSAADPSGKAVNKAELQKYMNLPQREEVPVFGIVSRLVGHKGFDLVKAVLEEFICTSDAQVIILGSGEWQYENFFRELAARYPDRVGLKLGFFADLANKIYAGSDIFLMPSKSEPCGLSQMISLRYGTIPIVRETGGLKDSIEDSNENTSVQINDIIEKVERGEYQPRTRLGTTSDYRSAKYSVCLEPEKLIDIALEDSIGRKIGDIVKSVGDEPIKGESAILDMIKSLLLYRTLTYSPIMPLTSSS